MGQRSEDPECVGPFSQPCPKTQAQGSGGKNPGREATAQTPRGCFNRPLKPSQDMSTQMFSIDICGLERIRRQQVQVLKTFRNEDFTTS